MFAVTYHKQSKALRSTLFLKVWINNLLFFLAENMKPEYDMLKKSIRSVKTILHGVDDTIKEYEKEKVSMDTEQMFSLPHY